MERKATGLEIKEVPRVPEILNQAVSTLIESYIRLLRRDIKEGEEGGEGLSPSAHKEAGRAIGELERLKELWSEFGRNPHSFRVSRYRFDALEEVSTREVWFLDQRIGERRLPTDPRHPAEQIKVEVIGLREPFLATREEDLLRSSSLKGYSSEEALRQWERIKAEARPDILLEISFNQVYWEEEEYRARVTPGSGLQFSFFPGKLVVNGLRFLGKTPHLTRNRLNRLPQETRLDYSRDVKPLLVILDEMRPQLKQER